MFEEKDQIAMNWVRQVLRKISARTPAIVVEEGMDLVGELEYNTTIRREYAHTVCSFSRELLRADGCYRRFRNTEAY
jgi:phosphatidylinositol 4-kinase